MIEIFPCTPKRVGPLALNNRMSVDRQLNQQLDLRRFYIGILASSFMVLQFYYLSVYFCTVDLLNHYSYFYGCQSSGQSGTRNWPS